MASSNAVRIELLNKDNFDTWVIQMEAILTKNDAWGYVSGDKVKPEIIAENAESVEASRAWDVEDKKAKSDIILAIKSSELKQIKGCHTSREVWAKLRSIYQSSGPARKATLLKQLTLHKMADGEDVREHLRKFFDTIDKLSEMEVEINPDLLTVMLLYSLPPNFENFRCAIESRDELPTPESLRIKIVEEFEARKKDTYEPNAMYTKKRPTNRKNRRQTGDSETKNTSKDEDAPKGEQFKYRCHRCKKVGHKATNCKERNTDNKANAADNVSLCVQIEETLLTETHDANVAKRDVKWCLDSGCTAHMGNTNVKFTGTLQNCNGNVNMASESASAQIQGKGTVAIVSEIDGHQRNVNVNEVLRVPKLRTNLLSVGKIADQNFKVIFEKEKAEIVDKNWNTILIADRKDGLYYLRETKDECNANAEVVEQRKARTAMETWHINMGHLNVRDLIQSERSGAVLGMDLGKAPEDLVCEICLRSKMTKTPFPKESKRASELLEIIHSDVIGPMRVESNGKARWVVTFIDDCSRWCEIRLLKGKDEVFSAFKDFKALVENQHGRKIKFLQSDNGTEYRNEPFDTFLRENGIGRRTTITHTPEQNGIAERRNRTLMDMTRCLLAQSSLPPSFWGEALNTANHIRNRCPSKSLGGKTAYEKWIAKAPDVSYFREFGSRVFTLDRSPTKGKLDPRSKEGIFVGYSSERKGYRIWLKNEKRIDIARDVKFVGLPNASIEVQQILTEEEDNLTHMEVVYPFGNVRDLSPPAAEARNQDDRVADVHDRIEEANDQALPNQEMPRRGRGRPRIVRTRQKGRPRKEFHVADCVNEIEEFSCLAEIPLEFAVHGPDAEESYQAMVSEIKLIIKNDTWTITNRPKDYKVIGSRVVLRNKYKHDGTLDRRKARIVAKGFAQRPGVDFNETFAPVARVGSIRTIAALAAGNGMILKQFDIATAYLNGELKEKVFMEIPKYTANVLERIVSMETTNSNLGRKAAKMLNDIESGDKVCSLSKALYGLKQAGRCWNERIDREIINFGAKKSDADPCVYVKGEGKGLILIVIYVDDIVVASQSEYEMIEFGRYLSNIFEIKDLGTMAYCLGMEFVQRINEISIYQSGYIRDVLDRFRMSDSKPVATPMDPGTKLEKDEGESSPNEEELPYRELIGSLMYLAVCTRPDIAFAVSYLSQFNSCYNKSHWTAAKRVLRYIKETQDLGLKYQKTGKPLHGYVDADWANCTIDRRSYTGYTFILGGCPISWESRKQRTVALSSTEAEYMALSESSKEASYLKRFLENAGVNNLIQVRIFCDNNGARKLAENPVFHNRSKHIDVRHHHVREVIGRGEIVVEYTPTDEMAADIFTKGLSRQKHVKCVELLGLTNISILNKDHPWIEGEYWIFEERARTIHGWM